MAVKIKPRYGRLSVVGQPYLPRHAVCSNQKVRCLCDCGRVVRVYVSNLRKGTSNSCGCLQKEQLTKRNKTHGHSHTRLYRIWKNMLSRCENPKNISYQNYGKRGIQVCRAWHNWQVFQIWAESNGYEDGLSIDRKKNQRGYTPLNTHWTTKGAQNHNQRKKENTASKYIGVHKHNNKWRAQISFEGAKSSLGTFNKELDAARAYYKRAMQLYREAAALNFPRKLHHA